MQQLYEPYGVNQQASTRVYVPPWRRKHMPGTANLTTMTVIMGPGEELTSIIMGNEHSLKLPFKRLSLCL